jgi:hypothetical protein
MKKHPQKNKKNFYFAYRSFWPEPEAHHRFDNIGVDTVCFFSANTTNSLGEPYCKYPPTWVADGYYNPEGKYDFGPADRQMADLMRDSPNAKFICMVDLNTPPWLSFLFRADSFLQLGRLCSDPEWRRVTALYMRSILAHMEKQYAGRISAYVLSCGNTSEWYDLSRLAESESRSAAWQSDRAARGLPPEDVPGCLARNHLSFDNLLRDPQADGEALRYIRFCAEQIVDSIKFFLKEARAVIRPEAELGVFFGYSLILEGERVIMGNNDCDDLLKSPDLDFIISPQGGFSRIGRGGGDLGPTDSIHLAGKRYLRECDQKTHCMNRRLSEYVTWARNPSWDNETETLAGIKRELAYTLIKQCSMWWFDMWGGFYDPPAVMTLLEKALGIYREHIGTPVESIAETALIVDPDSMYYLNQNDDGRTAWFYFHTKRILDLLGAPWECYSFNDIPKIPGRERIKLWLLPGIFEITPEKQEVLDRCVRCRGQTALYMYAPGISDGRTLDPRRVKNLAGFDFGTPGVSVAEMKNHRSAYAATGPDLTVPVLKDIARKAGIHLFSEHAQPVYANSRFLALHTANGGRQKICLPRTSAKVCELFSDRVVAGNCSEFEYEFSSPDTALFSW